jgi:predicted dehydrogenase
MRIGVIGLGLIAQVMHLPLLRQLSDRFEVTHLCDLSPGLTAAIARDYPGARASSDWQAVCDDPAVDAVLLLIPHGGHAPVALAALRAGKHVLCEKPLCVSQAEARELSAAAQAPDRVLQVGYMKMYDPIIERARAELGKIGPVRLIRVTVLHPSDEAQLDDVAVRQFADADRAALDAARAYEQARITDAVGAVPTELARLYSDVMLGSIVHELSLLRALGLPVPDRFDHAAGWPEAADRDGADPPSVTGTARLPGGTRLEISWIWLPDYQEYAEEVALFGARGRVYLEMPTPYRLAQRAVLRVERSDGTERAAATYVSGYQTGFERQLEAFHDSVTQGRPVLSGADGARQDIACLQQLLAAVAAADGISVGGEAGAPA